jgi:predicted metal-dependent hydrolase
MPTAEAPAHTDRSITTRRMVIEHGHDIPRHFVDGDLVQSHLMAVLSATFPKGEQFFVDSVRAYREEIDDDELRTQVTGFIGQESMHGREHDRLNRVLQDLGYPTRRVDQGTGAILGLFARVAPRSVQLALTAAAEHFTSVLAEQILDDDALASQHLSDELRALFQWHALEECEHKSVAFDVYQERVGSEVIRIATMHVVTALLTTVALGALAASVASDPASRNPVRLMRSVLGLRRSPFARRTIGLRLLEYNRPGFHPDDRDTEELLARWRVTLFGPEGTLNEHLTRRAAS